MPEAITWISRSLQLVRSDVVTLCVLVATFAALGLPVSVVGWTWLLATKSRAKLTDSTIDTTIDVGGIVSATWLLGVILLRTGAFLRSLT